MILPITAHSLLFVFNQITIKHEYLTHFISIKICSMWENNAFEDPKMAAIRLLKSQGCCPCNDGSKRNSELQQMLKYKQELQVRAAQERSRLSEIPCAITLAEEIEELREVVSGLGRENRGRLEYLRKLKAKTGHSSSWEVVDSEEQMEHERLQQEYANLMRTLEVTNENNRRLVERLTRP